MASPQWLEWPAGVTGPPLLLNVQESEGVPFVPAGAIADAKFYLYDLEAGSLLLNGVSTGVSTPSTSPLSCQYVWQAVTVKGRYVAWFTFTDSGNPRWSGTKGVWVRDPWEMVEL